MENTNFGFPLGWNQKARINTAERTAYIYPTLGYQFYYGYNRNSDLWNPNYTVL